MYDIRETPLNLMTSYLSCRQQCVNLPDMSSTIAPITISIPQKSILAPFLFNAFINDLSSYLHGNATLYADDTNIFILDNNIDKLLKRASHTLDRLRTWLSYNKLIPSTCKTNYILFASRKMLL